MMSVSGFNNQWIIDALISRNSQFSTCIVFETSDPKRFNQFVDYLIQSEHYAGYQIYIYWIWRGLYKLVKDVKAPSGIRYEPVRMISQSSSPLVQTITRVSSVSGIRDLNGALSYMDNLFMRSKNIIFIIYGVFKPNDNLTSAVRAWVFDDTMYARGHIIVIFTESAHAIFDDDTLKYLIYIRVPISFEEERKSILQGIIEQFKTKLPKLAKLELNGLVQATAGLTLHETESVALESLYRYKTLEYKALQKYKNELIKKMGILDIEEPTYGFEAVGGYDVVKDFIKVNVIKVLRNPEKARRLGIRPPRGILLFGPAGTGKTHFARALANELKLPFLRLRTEKIVHHLYGQTERLMSRALEIAESIAPCVLFIDEIDRFGQRGKFGEHEVTRRTFSILLEWLGDERRKTIVIATTNRPQDLDEAFIRVGRFDYIIPFLYPDFKARLEILKVHTSIIRKVPLAKNVDLKQIASRTELWSGAELQELVLRSARITLRRNGNVVTMSDFEEALASFRIPQDIRYEQLQRYLELAERFCNDTQFLENLKRTIDFGRLDAFRKQLEESL